MKSQGKYGRNSPGNLIYKQGLLRQEFLRSFQIENTKTQKLIETNGPHILDYLGGGYKINFNIDDT